jgi:putative transposase
VVRAKALTDDRLTELWRAVKEQDSDSFWDELKAEQLLAVKRIIETALEQEMIARLCAGRYERSGRRRGWRNGYYQRSILWQLGLIEGLRVPRARRGAHSTVLLERFRHRQGHLNRLVRETFLAGVSTRRVGEVLEPVLGERISPATVSNVCRALDREVGAYLSRPVGDHWVYLLLDGLTLKVKTQAGVKKRLVLVAYGIDEEARRHILAFRLATAESEVQWQAFLDDLYRRGLEGNALRLVISDGCKGLHKALDTVYPYVERQLCWVHKLRNLSQRVPARWRKECLAGASRIYQASTKREARARFGLWAQAWRERVPKAVACLEGDLEPLLAFLDCPQADWRRVRTTNAIERAFREVRRRIRPMSCFNDSPSCRRIIYGIINHLNNNWQDKAHSTHKT